MGVFVGALHRYLWSTITVLQSGASVGGGQPKLSWVCAARFLPSSSPTKCVISLSTWRRHPEKQVRCLATYQAYERNVNVHIVGLGAKTWVSDLGWRAAVAGRSGTANALRSHDSDRTGPWQLLQKMSPRSSSRPSGGAGERGR